MPSGIIGQGLVDPSAGNNMSTTMVEDSEFNFKQDDLDEYPLNRGKTPGADQKHQRNKSRIMREVKDRRDTFAQMKEERKEVASVKQEP